MPVAILHCLFMSVEVLWGRTYEGQATMGAPATLFCEAELIRAPELTPKEVSND
jgi:hypothetical protein